MNDQGVYERYSPTPPACTGLRTWRMRHAVRAEDLARALSCSVATVSRWENGHCAVPVELGWALKGLAFRTQHTERCPAPPPLTPQALRSFRWDNDLRQEDLAALLRLTVTTIARWERGEHPIPPYLAWVLKGVKFTHGPHCACGMCYSRYPRPSRARGLR